MINPLIIVQSIVGILMVFGILLQHRAAGLSATFGGAGTGTFVQRRGAERFLYQASVVLALFFFALTIVDWYI